MHDNYYEEDEEDDFIFDIDPLEVCRGWSTDDIVDFYLQSTHGEIADAIAKFQSVERYEVCAALKKIL